MTCERCGGESGDYRVHPDPMVCIGVLEGVAEGLRAENARLAAGLAEAKDSGDGYRKMALLREAETTAERESQDEQGQWGDVRDKLQELRGDDETMSDIALSWQHAAEDAQRERDRLVGQLRDANNLVATYIGGQEKLRADRDRLAAELEAAKARIAEAVADEPRDAAALLAERSAHAQTRLNADAAVTKHVLDADAQKVRADKAEARADRAEALLVEGSIAEIGARNFNVNSLRRQCDHAVDARDRAEAELVQVKADRAEYIAAYIAEAKASTAEFQAEYGELRKAKDRAEAVIAGLRVWLEDMGHRIGHETTPHMALAKLDKLEREADRG